jgi:hypothetical protein
MKTGIFIFTKASRKIYIKTCLYFLFKNYNHLHNHNVYILNEDLSKEDKEEILLGIRSDCRHNIFFKDIVLRTPDDIDSDKLTSSLNCNMTMDWSDIEYRNLTYFMLYTFWEEGGIGNEFDYIMKLNDDVYIEEPVKEDLFKIIDNRANNVLFCLMSNQCIFSSFGMYDLLRANFPENIDKLNSFNNSIKITDENSISDFKKLHAIVFDKDYSLNEIELRQPYIPTDSFYIIRTSFMTGNKISPYMNKIKELKYIHYFKWSFSLVVSSLAMMLCNDKVTRCVFKMTEEKHRNAYIEYGKIISKVPDSYKK